MEKISILIADDHRLIRETWSQILNEVPGFNVIAACGNAEEAVKLAREKRPNVILMDINMPPFSGLEATERILKILPGCKIIGVSIYSQPAYAKKMLQIGGRGYVTKNSSQEDMIKAILEVNKGNKYICDEIKNIISEQLMDDNQSIPSISALTEREMQITDFIKEGYPSKRIADKLKICLKTVEVHRHNILKKLKVKNSASLVNFMHINSSYI